ncbi:MAG TPA: MFS transporter [Vicinamibacterales bacterium]
MSQTVDVERILDGGRFRGLPAVIMLCMVAVLIIDGFDIQVIGFVAPALAAEFQVERGALSPVLAASLLGMGVGAFAVGPVGDRWGRRPALLSSVALFGTATLLGATVHSLEALTLWRFITGVGLGGALPNATALMAEFAPPRWRSQSIAAAIVGVPLGGMLGAAIAAELVPAYGWRAIFIVGGLLPLLAGAVIYRLVPESPRFLVTRPERARELARILNRLEGEARYNGEEQFVQSGLAPAKTTAGLRVLFSRTYLRDTVAAWLIFGTNIFAVYAFFNWAPVVLTSLGLDLATAVRGAFVYNLAGVIGALGNAWLIARFGSRWPLATLTAVGVLALVYLAFLSRSAQAAAGLQGMLPALMSGIAVAGLATNAVQIGMYGVAAHIYPTQCRSSGVGWALGVGRLGGILSSFAGGLLLTYAGGAAFFAGVALVLGVTLASVLAVSRHIPPQTV